MRSMRVWERIGTVAVAAALTAGVMAACSGGDNGSKASASAGSDAGAAKKAEQAAQDADYATAVAQVPAAHCDGRCPSRATVNFWIDIWKVPGQLDFVYYRENGQTTGYYVFAGPPVSLCTSITPPYTTKKINADGSGGADEDVIVSAPGMDGVYYSGGDCNRLYGKDATTGRYIGFMIGYGASIVESTTPMPQYAQAPKLGDADAAKATVDPKTGVAKVAP